MRIEPFVDEGLGNTTHLVYAAGSGAAEAVRTHLAAVGALTFASGVVVAGVMYETLPSRTTGA